MPDRRIRSDRLIIVDVEATSRTPISGVMTEFGAVNVGTDHDFYARLWSHTEWDGPVPHLTPESKEIDPHYSMSLFRDWVREEVPSGRPVFVSDNPTYDGMWIACAFDRVGVENPFGHSGRRIGDFYAGLRDNWNDTQTWKRLRVTSHDHNPVNDARGNAEALRRIFAGER